MYKAMNIRDKPNKNSKTEFPGLEIIKLGDREYQEIKLRKVM